MSELKTYNGNIAARSDYQAKSARLAIARANQERENKGQYITLNIGLENNPLDYADIIYLTNVLLDSFYSASRIEEGIYNGELERTLILRAHVKKDMLTTQSKITLLTLALDQECIALQYDDGLSALVYSPLFTGEKLVFNSDYFLTIGGAK